MTEGDPVADNTISAMLAKVKRELLSSPPPAEPRRPVLCDCEAFARRIHTMVLRGMVPGNSTDPGLTVHVRAFQAELDVLPEGCRAAHDDLFAQKMQFHDQALAQLGYAILQSWKTVASAMQQREQNRAQHDAATDAEAEQWRQWSREMFPHHTPSTDSDPTPLPPKTFVDNEYAQAEQAVARQKALLDAKVVEITEALHRQPSPDTMGPLRKEEQELRRAFDRAIHYKAVVRERLLTSSSSLAVFRDPPTSPPPITAPGSDEEVAEAIGRVIEEESLKQKLCEYFDTREYLSYLVESHAAAMENFTTTLFANLNHICGGIDTATDCACCLFRQDVARRTAFVAKLYTGGHAILAARANV